MSVPVRKRLAWPTVITLLILLAGIVLVQIRIDATQQTLAKHKDEMLVESGPLLKKLSLGYESLLADVYWTRAVQFYGAKLPTNDRDFSLLVPMLDVATTLDPNLIVAYHFGAFFLSERQGGAARPDLAVALVKKGVEANPDSWQLAGDLGFLYYLRLNDYDKAAVAYLKASKIPGAPEIFRVVAARVASKGGAIETSRMIWTEVFDSTQDPKVKDYALGQLKELRIQQDESQINQLGQDYFARFGSYPNSMMDFISTGMIASAPVDSEGFPYIIGPDGKAQLNPKSPLDVRPDQPPPQ